MSSEASAASICVFCGSSPGNKPDYIEAAKDVGTTLASNGIRLVYGGGHRGIMGAVSSATLKANGSVLGVMPGIMLTTPQRPGGDAGAAAPAASTEGSGPEMWQSAESTSNKLQSIIVDSMHERKTVMEAESSAFVVVPGGYGTFEEAFEMVGWCQLGIHRKPVVFLNICNFYDAARALVDHATAEGFISAAGRELIVFVEPADAAAAGSWGQAALAAVKAKGQAIAAAGPGYWNWSNGSPSGTNDTTAPKPLAEVEGNDRAIDVSDLTFSFAPEAPPALIDCNLSLTRGSRCLLIGANGAGKSTILRLLAGKRLPGRNAHVKVFGKDVFHDAPRGICYLGTEWAMNPVVRSDIVVSRFLDSVGGYRHKERRDRLLDILDVDVNWRMHRISDGERRRVQLTMGLMEEWNVLLLDEVTVDLDVQVRADLLAFLMEETQKRGATIIYATHIFDGLQGFPTHVVHMRLGQTTTKLPISWPPSPQTSSKTVTGEDALPHIDAKSDGRDASLLLATALAWLRQDRLKRIEKEQADGTGPKRGAKANKDTDSETFYSKYDYSA